MPFRTLVYFAFVPFTISIFARLRCLSQRKDPTLAFRVYSFLCPPLRPIFLPFSAPVSYRLFCTYKDSSRRLFSTLLFPAFTPLSFFLLRSARKTLSGLHPSLRHSYKSLFRSSLNPSRMHRLDLPPSLELSAWKISLIGLLPPFAVSSFCFCFVVS